MAYDWLAVLAYLLTLIVLTRVGSFLAFKNPTLKKMRELNQEQDRIKLTRKPFLEATEVSKRAGLITNGIFYIAILPFCLNLEPRPLWRHAVDIAAVLFVFDFFY